MFRTVVQATFGVSANLGVKLNYYTIKNIIFLGEDVNFLTHTVPKGLKVMSFPQLSPWKLVGPRQHPTDINGDPGGSRSLERDVYSFNAKIKAEVARGDFSGVGKPISGN